MGTVTPGNGQQGTKVTLAGTSLLRDTQLLRAAGADELRRVRRALRGSGRAHWLERFGLVRSVGRCPLTGDDAPALERWCVGEAPIQSPPLFAPLAL